MSFTKEKITDVCGQLVDEMANHQETASDNYLFYPEELGAERLDDVDQEDLDTLAGAAKVACEEAGFQPWVDFPEEITVPKAYIWEDYIRIDLCVSVD